MISAVVTTYNGEKYVIEQLESIRSQTVSVDEVIISDDHSQDKTPLLIHEFIAAQRLRHWSLYVHARNQGWCENAYYCLTRAHGDIIFLCDQDNIWAPDYVEATLKAITQDDTIMALAVLYRWVDARGDPITDRRVLRALGVPRWSAGQELVELPFGTWLGSTAVPWCTLCIQRRVRDAIVAGGIPRLSKSIGIDAYAGLMGSVLGRTVRLNRVLLYRRVHDSNISLGALRKKTVLSSTNARRLEMLEEAAQAHRAFLGDKTVSAHISADWRSRVEALIDLYERRIRFCRDPRLLRGICLAMYLDRYCWCYDGFWRAVRMWLADWMYAYGINWRLKE
jgi:glycosyltransferase involved in cell wall biosynthesis